MKTIFAAISMAALCFVPLAVGEEVPDLLLTYFGNDFYIGNCDVIEEVPTVLLLEEPLRQKLLMSWEEQAPLSPGAIRGKGLLLEDLGDLKAGECLKALPGDQVRLLWRAGKKQEARDIWLGIAEPSRREQASVAMLPVVAKHGATEISEFRDFLLEGLPAADVVRLCRVAGLPPSVEEIPEVKVEWLREFPELLQQEGQGLPEATRLALALETGRLSQEQFKEIRKLLKASDRPAADREAILDVLARDPTSIPCIPSILLCDWMDAHPDEVAAIIVRRVAAGNRGFADQCGLAGMIQVQRLLAKEPENKVARFAVVRALRTFGGTPDEVAAVWRTCLDSAMAVPLSLPPKANSRGVALTLEEAALDFAHERLPLHLRESWFREWQAAKPRSTGDLVRMTAWLGLDEFFWKTWPEAAKDPTLMPVLLEWVARGRLTYVEKPVLLPLLEEMAGEPLAERVRSQLGMPPPKKAPGESSPPNKPPRWPVVRMEFGQAEKLAGFRMLLANALAVENPFRSPGPVYKRFAGGSGIQLYGFRGLLSRGSERLWWEPMLAAGMGPALLREGADHEIARSLERIDRSRLSTRSIRSLEVNRVGMLNPDDPSALDALRKQLQAWWDADRDTEAGKMLLDYRTHRDRAAWPEWRQTWKEIIAGTPAHQRAPLAWRFFHYVSEEYHEEFRQIADGGKEHEDKLRKWAFVQAPDADPPPELMVAAARAEVLLGRDENPLLWRSNDDEPPRQEFVRGVAEGLVALAAMGASEADQALAAYRVSTPENRREAAARLVASGRITSDLAAASYPRYRRQRNKELIERCVETLVSQNPGKAIRLLDDPFLIASFGEEKVESWALRAVSGGRPPGFSQGEDLPSPLPPIVAMFAQAGNPSAALRFAKAGLQVDPQCLDQMLPWLPRGKERLEILATWLTGKSPERRSGQWQEVRRVPKPSELPALGSAEWRELLTMLAGDERWEIRSPAMLSPVLMGLIAAGSSDPAELAALTGASEKDLIERFRWNSTPRSPAPEERQPPDYEDRLSHMVANFARKIPPGEASSALVEMLSHYPAGDAGIEEAFRIHLAATIEPPSSEVLQQALACMDVPTAIALVNRPGVPNKRSIDPIDAAFAFAKAGYWREGWDLVGPRWQELKDEALRRRNPPTDFLLMARAAGAKDAVQGMVEVSKVPDYDIIKESKAWLDGKAEGPTRLQTRNLLLESTRARVEWCLASEAELAEAVEGELEVVGIEANSNQRSLWRGPAKGLIGSADFELPTVCPRIETRYRSSSGQILTTGSYTYPSQALAQRESGAGEPCPGPLPELPAKAIRRSGVLAEADVKLPGGYDCSVWIRGPLLSETWLALTIIDEQGHVVHTAQNPVRCCEDRWSLNSLRIYPPDGLPPGKGRLQVSIRRSGGKAVEIAGLCFTKNIDDSKPPEKSGEEEFGRVALEAWWLDASGMPWLIGGKARTGPTWMTWDPLTKQAGECHYARSGPIWMQRTERGLLFLGKDGDLWLYRPEASLPELVLAFGDEPPYLAASADGRLLAANNKSRQLTIWSLAAEGPPNAVVSKVLPAYSWHAFSGTGENALLATGSYRSPSPVWYLPSDLSIVEGRSGELPPMIRESEGGMLLTRQGLKVSSGYGGIGVSDRKETTYEALPPRNVRGLSWTADGKLACIDTSGGIYLTTPRPAEAK